MFDKIKALRDLYDQYDRQSCYFLVKDLQFTMKLIKFKKLNNLQAENILAPQKSKHTEFELKIWKDQSSKYKRRTQFATENGLFEMGKPGFLSYTSFQSFLERRLSLFKCWNRLLYCTLPMSIAIWKKKSSHLNNRWYWNTQKNKYPIAVVENMRLNACSQSNEKNLFANLIHYFQKKLYIHI